MWHFHFCSVYIGIKTRYDNTVNSCYLDKIVTSYESVPIHPNRRSLIKTVLLIISVFLFDEIYLRKQNTLSRSLSLFLYLFVFSSIYHIFLSFEEDSQWVYGAKIYIDATWCRVGVNTTSFLRYMPAELVCANRLHCVPFHLRKQTTLCAVPPAQNDYTVCHPICIFWTHFCLGNSKLFHNRTITIFFPVS